MLSIGVKESTRFNSIFTGLNLLVVLFIVIAGSFKADIKNWTIPEDDVPKGLAYMNDFGFQLNSCSNNQYFYCSHGSGGFMPFGFSGMMAGAATCFYGTNHLFCLLIRTLIIQYMSIPIKDLLVSM
jgi:cationic amino acid transporter 2